MEVVYVPYEARRALNVYRHVDDWFWNKYSAHPYVGCQFGCEYCYWREEKYNMLARDRDAQQYRDPFSQYIKVKVNAPELLRNELSKVRRDIIATGDYQPAETRYRLSRKMLGACLELGFPVLILEKSPLVLRDLDLLWRIHEKAWACIIFSIVTSVSKGYREVFEPRAPGIEGKFKAMRKVSEAGVPTGTAFMPILPFICDDERNLEAVVRKTREHGGSFVLAGGLTMGGAQAKRYMQVIATHYPSLVSAYDELYMGQSSTVKSHYWRRIGWKVREMCGRYGVMDRMPRYVEKGALALNKRVAEALFNDVYSMELNGESAYKIWAYRRAAWTIDELGESIEEVYGKSGVEGLRSIPSIGKGLAQRVGRILRELCQGV